MLSLAITPKTPLCATDAVAGPLRSCSCLCALQNHPRGDTIFIVIVAIRR
jgi:hypothetical protein